MRQQRSVLFRREIYFALGAIFGKFCVPKWYCFKKQTEIKMVYVINTCPLIIVCSVSTTLLLWLLVFFAVELLILLILKHAFRS